ncbi:MAG TPA: hypothetical protein VEQ42_07725 [Pyrinomonadaceae bacterium]|nr:hypothetical protein [Pyrinomonadaceae bacterium]
MNTDARPATPATTESRPSYIPRSRPFNIKRRRAFDIKPACLLAALLLTLALPAVASAYTLVMRGGRRVEISDNFTVTADSLTHEPAPGLRVSVRLEHVDIDATERANGEPAGTFLKRIAAAVPAPSAQSPAVRRTKVVTNKDLEAFRRERVRNEEEYERVRGERGLPSREEWRRSSEEQDRRYVELARRIETEERAAEQERLAGELLTLRAQLGLLQAQQSFAPYAPQVVYYPTDLFQTFPRAFARQALGRHRVFGVTHLGGHFFGQRPFGRANLFLRFGTPPPRGHVRGGGGRRGSRRH